ncbi:MAG: hypothetical protein Ct9H300mP1_30930 [Planctomycetaceae bacterium]|nr:MAG: hypothetical protein Ct9H300mP1_30930 [Planctomycetaceae bacterium]
MGSHRSREAWIPHGSQPNSYDRLVVMYASPVRNGDEDWIYATVMTVTTPVEWATADRGGAVGRSTPRNTTVTSACRPATRPRY